MSVLSVTNSINAQTVTYLPSVVAAVQAAEVLGPEATGAQKSAAVVAAVSQSLGASSNPNVAAISNLASLVVLVANLLGAFKHKTPSVLAATK
jgi:hypothetical protein